MLWAKGHECEVKCGLKEDGHCGSAVMPRLWNLLQKERKRGYRVEIKFIDTVIYFGSCHLNTLFILRSIHLLPRPLTWAEQTFSIHPYTSQTKPLLGEVDRGSEKDSGVVGSIQKWEMLSFMQTRRKNASQKCRLWVSQGAGVLHGIKQKSLNHIVCIFNLDFICNCD